MTRVYLTFACLSAISLITGCGSSEEKKDAAVGAVEGGKEFVQAVGDALTAWETTGLTGAAVVLGIGVWKAVSKGMAKANKRKAERDAAAPREG